MSFANCVQLTTKEIRWLYVCILYKSNCSVIGSQFFSVISRDNNAVFASFFSRIYSKWGPELKN
jgi:hypothetical protein